MKLQLGKIIQKIHDISSVSLLALTLCCVLLCGMMYAQMMETNRLCVQLAVQLDGLQGGMQITDTDVPLSNGIKDLQAGDTVTVKVYAEQVSDLYGYQFKLNFNESDLEYKKLRTSIPEIGTIFKKPFDGYILVGATMIGNEPGYSAIDTPICEIELCALKDGIVPDFSITEVESVNSQLEYNEDVSDWTLTLN